MKKEDYKLKIKIIDTRHKKNIMGNITETILSYLPTNQDIKNSELNVIRDRLQNIGLQLRADIRKSQHDIDRVTNEKDSLIKNICNHEHDKVMCDYWAKEIYFLEQRRESFCESKISKQQLINDVEKTLSISNEEALLEQYQLILNKMNPGSMMNSLTHIKSQTSELSTLYDTLPQIDVNQIIENALLRKRLPEFSENDPGSFMYTGIIPDNCHS